MLNRLLLIVLTASVFISPLAVLPAVEWHFTDPEWVEGSSGDAEPTFNREAQQVVVMAPRDRAIHLERPLAMDGDDAEPLIISCALSALGDGALRQAPMGFSVVWPDAEVFVGLSTQRDMHGVVRWRVDGETAGVSDSTNLDPASLLNYVRIVVTRRLVDCSVSGDGTTWRRIHSLERTGPLAVAPQRLVLGAGWGGAENLDRTIDPVAEPQPGEPGTVEYFFGQLTVARWSAQVPASLLATYSRGESREATVDALVAESFPRTWWVAGPFPSRAGTYGPETEPFDPTQPVVSGDESRAWAEVMVGEELHQRLIVLDQRTGDRTGHHVFFATTVIDSPAARRVRLLYDGFHSVALFVNGKALSVDRHSRSGSETAEVDRLSAVVDFQEGRNVVTLRLTTTDHGGCAFIFRTESGDPRYRIALERRLALDFGHDVEELAAGLFEAARLWEELGHAVAAAAVLDEVIANEEMPMAVHERALLERTRLHAHVRDQEQVDRDVAALREFWTEHDGVDRATVMRRAADLWSRLGQSDRASAELAQAIQVDDLSRARRFDVLIDQLRLQIQSGSPEDLAALIAAAAVHFPPDDRLHAYVARVDSDIAAAQALLAVRDAEVIRMVAGIARAAADQATLLAALRILVDLEPAGVSDDPAVTLAEHAAASGDPQGAVKAYRIALARQGLDAPVSNLDQARVAYLEGRLRRVPGVSELMAQPDPGDPGIAADMPITDWQVIGPFPNPDWVAYTNLPIDPATTRGKGKEGGLEWQSTTSEHYADEVLDFNRLFPKNEHVALCYRLITSPQDLKAALAFGADDAAIVWLNGVKLHEDRVQRAVTPDSLSVDLALKKGDNHLVVLVQNGSGGWGLQARVLVPALAENQFRNALQAAVTQPGERQAVAERLAEACQASLRFGRSGLVGAVCPILFAAFPDQGEALVPLAQRFLNGSMAQDHPETAIAALRWWDARDRMDFTVGENPPRLVNGQRLVAAHILIELGALTEAAAILEPVPLTATDADTFSTAMQQFGDIRLLLGDISGAQRWFERAVAVQGGNGGAQRLARDALASIRRIRVEVRPVTTSPDAMTAAQSAERAAAAQDIEHAEQAFQQALSLGASEILPTTEGRYMGIAWWSMQRLRSLPPAAQHTYVQRLGRLAEQALVAALARDDVDALERVAARWPIAPAAATALIEAAQRYRAAGAQPLAEATAQLAVERFQLSPELAALASALRVTPTASTAPVIEAVGGSAPITLSPTTLHDLKRYVGEGERPVHVPLLPALGDGMTVLHSGVEVVAFDLTSGRERWRHPATAVGQPGMPDHRGQRLHGAVIVDGIVAGLSVAGERPMIEARDTQDGTLRWATYQRADLGDFIPIASPATDGTRVLVLGLEGERGVLCALRPRDGAVLWRSTLPIAMAGLVITNGTNIDLGRHQGPPVVVGREIFVTLDSGALISIDAPTGVVRWVATYPRGVFHAEGSHRVLATMLDRSPGAIAVGTDTVVLLPRDRSGAFAFARNDGAFRWNIDHSDARVLSGAYRSGEQEVVLLSGSTVQAIDLADGRVRWTWRPSDSAVCGTPVVVGDTVHVSTARALHVLTLADGQPAGPAKAWSALGYAGSTPGQFIAHDQRLVAASAAGLVILGPGPVPAKPVVLIPALMRSAESPPTVPATVDPEAALGIAWRLAGERFVSQIHAEDPRPDELFLRLQNGLVRMSRDLRTVHWHLRLPADVRDIAVHGDQVVVITDATVVAYHREHAAVRWAAAEVSSPARPEAATLRLRVGVGPRTAVAYAQGYSELTVRQARTGTLVWRGSLPAQVILWAGEVGEDLVTVVVVDHKRVVIQRRDPAQPHIVRAETSHEMKTSHAEVHRIPGRPILVMMGEEAAWLDLAKAEITPLNLAGWPVAFEVHQDGIDIVTWNHRSFSYHVLDPADGTVRFDHRYHDGWLNDADKHMLRYGRSGDTLIRQNMGDHYHLELFGVGIDGKERFKRQDEAFKRMRPVMTVGIGGHIHALAWSEGRLHARRLSTNGEVVAQALIPMHLADGPIRYSIDRDVMIMDSEDGVVILRGLKDPQAVAEHASPELLDLRARLGVVEPTAVVAPLLEVMPVIDGHLEEWPEASGQVVTAAGIRALGGTTPPPSLRWWAGYTAEGLVLAAEVGASTAAMFGPGLPPLASPGLLVGIAPLDDDHDDSLVFHLGVANGRTVLRTLRGVAVTDTGAQDIQARSSHAGDITRYELAIPWALLRHQDDQRPGHRTQMRIGMATIHPDRGSSREAGFGLLHGDSNRWWIPIALKP